MIDAVKNELFPILVSLVDEFSGTLVPGGNVLYDIRNINDTPLIPPISGSLVESSVEAGIYKKEISIPTAGSYICYATCSGFLASTETIAIKEESIFDMYKYNLPYNTSVIDVQRTSISGTLSQIARNVPLNKTDYIVSMTKHDTDLNWNNPVSSGVSYAHYKSINDDLPYMMAGEF